MDKQAGRQVKKTSQLTTHALVHATQQNNPQATSRQTRNHQKGLTKFKALTLANAPSGIFPSHLSSTFSIFIPSPPSAVQILTLLLITCSLPIPLTTYLVFKSNSIGFPAPTTWERNCSMVEKAAARPYHCAEYCL